MGVATMPSDRHERTIEQILRDAEQARFDRSCGQGRERVLRALRTDYAEQKQEKRNHYNKCMLAAYRFSQFVFWAARV